MLYICNVFFMVLDLRLGRLEVGRLPSLFLGGRICNKHDINNIFLKNKAIFPVQLATQTEPCPAHITSQTQLSLRSPAKRDYLLGE